MTQENKAITDSGFITLHRKLLEWEWYTDINTKCLFIHLLIKANHTTKKYRGETIKRGSFVTSYAILAHETGLSVKSVRTALDKLIKTGEVAKLTSPLGTCILIKKYDDYQTQGQAKGKAGANQGQAEGKAGATTNNDNNDNNDNNKLCKKDFELIYFTYRPSARVLPKSDSQEYKRTCKVVKELGSVEEVVKVIKEYFQYLSTEDWRKPKGYKEFMNSPEHYGNNWLGNKSTQSTDTSEEDEIARQMIEQRRKARQNG